MSQKQPIQYYFLSLSPSDAESEKAVAPTPVFFPGESHGQRSLEGCSPCGHWGLDMTERLHFHFSLSRIGEGNGNPLQCSCLENPRDEGAWGAAVYGVAQSRTWLKRLSSSSSSGDAEWRKLAVEANSGACVDQTCILSGKRIGISNPQGLLWLTVLFQW